MENLIYSINVTFPIFLVMVLGWALKQKGMLNDNFITVANSFNFSVTLPVMLFRDISAVDIYDTFDLKYVLFCAVSSSVCFWGIWALTRMFLKDRTLRGAFVQASFRSSAAVMGLAFIENIYGSSAMGPMMIIGAVPLYNIYSVIVLTFEAPQAEEEKNMPSGRNKKIPFGHPFMPSGKNKEIPSGHPFVPSGRNKEISQIKQACVNILKNPIIIAIFLGIGASLLKIRFPLLIDRTIENVAKIATPLALIVMGAGFKGKEALAKRKPALAAAFIKLIAQAAVFIPIAAKMGFRNEKIIGILIMLAAPATPSCYIMAKNMNNDGDLTASIVVVTTLLAAFTLSGWIFLLKTWGLI